MNRYDAEIRTPDGRWAGNPDAKNMLIGQRSGEERSVITGFRMQAAALGGRHRLIRLVDMPEGTTRRQVLLEVDAGQGIEIGYYLAEGSLFGVDGDVVIRRLTWKGSVNDSPLSPSECEALGHPCPPHQGEAATNDEIERERAGLQAIAHRL